MHSFSNPRKFWGCQAFYSNIFNPDFTLEYNADLAKEFSLLFNNVRQNARLEVGHVVIGWITHVQYLMLDQTNESKNKIAIAGAEKLMRFVKKVFDRLHPGERGEDIEQYWRFIKDAFITSIVTDINDSLVRDYMESLHLHNAFLQNRHPYLLTTSLEILPKIANALGLDEHEQSVTAQVRKESVNKVVEVYHDLTRPVVHYLFILFILSLCVGAWYFDLPAIAGVIGAAGLVRCGVQAASDRKLNKEVREKFKARATQHHFNQTGERLNHKLNTTVDIEQYALHLGIKCYVNDLVSSRKLIKRNIAPQGEAVREVYIAVFDNFPKIYEITLTQQRKLKAKKSILEYKATELTTTHTHLRKIVLPDNYAHKLIECPNNSLIIIKKPTPESKISVDELDEMMGPRGGIVAKKFGQSGIKILRDHNFWVKDKNSNKRVLLEQVDDERIVVDGKSQNVPVFEPVKVVLK